MNKTATWYFDFISPFAYLQHESFGQIPDGVAIEYKPILFAGLLNHLNHKGPAEIPKKRIWTYQHTLWLAKKAGIPMKYPEAHPFNPLKALRLSIANGNRSEAVAAIFRYLWRDGLSLDDEPRFEALARSLGVDNVRDRIAEPSVKDRLKQNTQEAIEANVFGVPTFIVNSRLFWGFDATGMVADYLNGDPLFEDPEMVRIEELPVAAARR